MNIKTQLCNRISFQGRRPSRSKGIPSVDQVLRNISLNVTFTFLQILHSNIQKITLDFTQILRKSLSLSLKYLTRPICTVGGGRLQAGAKSWRKDNAVDSRGDYYHYNFTPEPRGKFFKSLITFISFLFKSLEVNIIEDKIIELN